MHTCVCQRFLLNTYVPIVWVYVHCQVSVCVWRFCWCLQFPCLVPPSKEPTLWQIRDGLLSLAYKIECGVNNPMEIAAIM
jgi:hypothetical protein